MNQRKKTVLLHGNCQGQWLADRLRANPVIADSHEIIYLANFGKRPEGHPITRPGFLKSCDWILWQTAAGTPKPDFVDEAPSACRQFRFPTLWLKMFWPMNAVDQRNVDDPQYPWGRFPNGDKIVLRLLEKGVAVSEIPKAYVETDLNTLVSLEKYRDITLRELEINDRQSDVAATPYLLATLRERQLFATINHPTVRMLARLEDALTAALLGTHPDSGTPEPEDADDYIGSEEVPLHPQIIEFFKLDWAKPAMKWHFRSAFLSLSEYLQAYASWTAIPFGDPPMLWMNRAQQAINQGQNAKARHLLLEAAGMYPDLVQFLQMLGLLLLQTSQLQEAEQVFRFAIARHPKVAALHAKLGTVLQKRGFVAAARDCFAEAQRLEHGTMRSP